MKMNFKIKNKNDYNYLKDFCKIHRLKSSQKRIFIIDYFLKQDKHYSIEELYNEIKIKYPGIGYSTVYRTLKLLVECGLASERHFQKGSTRYEPVHMEKDHDHLICTRCGAIIEFTNPQIEKIQQKIAENFKFYVSTHKLEIYGLCQKCVKEKKKR